MGKRKGECLSLTALLLVFMLTTLFFYMVYNMHYDSASDDFTGFTVFDYQSEPGVQASAELGTLREDLDDWARRNQAVVFVLRRIRNVHDVSGKQPLHGHTPPVWCSLYIPIYKASASLDVHRGIGNGSWIYTRANAALLNTWGGIYECCHIKRRMQHLVYLCGSDDMFPELAAKASRNGGALLIWYGSRYSRTSERNGHGPSFTPLWQR